jgi:hypothetical protein
MPQETPFQQTVGSTSPPGNSRRIPLQWLIAIPLLAIAIGGFSWYILTTPPQPKVQGEQPYIPPDGLLRAGNSEFDRYQDFFRIDSVKGKILFNFANDRAIMVSGMFENRGEKYVDAAEIKLTFLDPEGKLIKERIAAPLRPETGMRMPMKGLERRNWSVRFDNMPVDLKVGDLTVVLTGLKFAAKKS